MSVLQPMDLAEVVAARLLAASAICDWPQEGTPGRALPVIALPATAGTGSEVTSVAVLTKDDAEASEQLPGLLTALAQSVGTEPGLDTLGVTEADLTGFATAAAGITRLTQESPRPVDAQALYGVLRDALDAGS